MPAGSFLLIAACSERLAHIWLWGTTIKSASEWKYVHHSFGLSHIAHHPYETQEARNQSKLGHGEKGAFHSCAYLHHSKKRRWQDHPHPQIFQARTLSHPHLRCPKTPPSARQNHQDDPIENINM